MKKVKVLFTGLCIMSILLMNCKKDKDDKTNKNYIKIGSTEYNLSFGTLDNYGTDEGNIWYYGYNTDVTLFSDGFTLQTDEDGEWYLTGKGHGIYFELFSTAGNVLNIGDYNFSITEPYPIGSFSAGGYVINYNTENDESDDEAEIISGKVSVSKNGNEYSITIDCVDENGKKIAGFYKGTLNYYDWTEDLKSALVKSTWQKRFQ